MLLQLEGLTGFIVSFNRSVEVRVQAATAVLANIMFLLHAYRLTCKLTDDMVVPVVPC